MLLIFIKPVSHLTLFSPCHTSSSSLLHADFYDWFTGFFEGDGSFCFSQRQPPRRPEWSLSLKQKDRGVLEWIHWHLKCGHITTDSKGYSSLRITKTREICDVLDILVTRIKLKHNFSKLEKWIKTFDQAKQTQYAQKIMHHESVDLQSAWLSGFMQAEGHFRSELYLRPGGRGYSILLRIGFTQNHGWHLFSQLQEILQTGSLRHDKKTDRFVVSSQRGLALLIDYFHRFPLQGQKQKAYHRWLKVYQLRTHKGVLPPHTSNAYIDFVKSIRSVNKEE